MTLQRFKKYVLLTSKDKEQLIKTSNKILTRHGAEIIE